MGLVSTCYGREALQYVGDLQAIGWGEGPLLLTADSNTSHQRGRGFKNQDFSYLD